MFINNKKFMVGLVVLTIVSGVYMAKSVPMPMPLQDLQAISKDINSSLPLQIDNSTSLRKTSVSTKEGINSFTFYYLFEQNMADINLPALNKRKLNLIEQACTTEPTKEILKHSTVITYQYVTIDQKSLPPLNILPRDCKVS